MSAHLHPRLLQPPVGLLFGLKSLLTGRFLQDMMSCNTARGQTVRNYVEIFTHFIARKVVPQTTNLMNLINNVHTAYVILLSHFRGLFSIM